MEVLDLGLRGYEEVWRLQQELVERRADGATSDTLILCEHEPVYTIGASSKQPVPEGLPYQVHRVERGGDITYHGPGQLVGYPILGLDALGLRPRTYLRELEQMLADALRPLGLEAQTLRGFTGLWARGRKIASIGVAVRRGVSFHGFALNVRCDLQPFSAIHPCKLQPDQLTSLETVLGAAVPMDEVRGSVREQCLARFGLARAGARNLIAA